jgi:hypothetical protein|nr:MAG TPA: phosphocarrier protein HPr [Caudoviricetes sp.]
MKAKYILNLNSMTDLCHFVSEISKDISCEIDASFGRHCVDAKSLMGVASLSSNPITVELNNPTMESDVIRFAEICEKYKIEEK